MYCIPTTRGEWDFKSGVANCRYTCRWRARAFVVGCHDRTPDHSRALTGRFPAAFTFCPSDCRFLRVTFILWAMFSHPLMHTNLCY